MRKCFIRKAKTDYQMKTENKSMACLLFTRTA